jgi:hypothetical protein
MFVRFLVCVIVHLSRTGLFVLISMLLNFLISNSHMLCFLLTISIVLVIVIRRRLYDS